MSEYFFCDILFDEFCGNSADFFGMFEYVFWRVSVGLSC